ncbi:MAG TPA: pentapeptide repeat-containing protein [Gammaproteobacteria bacterium]|nr:pentapeptide repeat-containing protein [Gammaproteobacteria bacterium]
MNTKENTDYLWYTRNDNGVKGPFTIGMMHRFVLVGRLKMDDEISSDKKEWRTVRETPVVMPEEMCNIETENDHQRLLQAQLREDERAKDRRRTELGEFQGRREKTDRRQAERLNARVHREIRNQSHDTIMNKPGSTSPLPFIVFFVLFAVIIFLVFFVWFNEGDKTVQISDCASKPAAGVNWNHCQMQGIQLSGENIQGAHMNNANLTGANLQNTRLMQSDLAYANLGIANLREADLYGSILKGANLSGADLRQANFSKTDLSFADLRNANIKGADFKGALLSRTIWVDGTLCMPGSIGRCRRAVKK